jgi:hypothetical protein
MTYRELEPPPSTVLYVPRVFGYKIHNRGANRRRLAVTATEEEEAQVSLHIVSCLFLAQSLLVFGIPWVQHVVVPKHLRSVGLLRGGGWTVCWVWGPLHVSGPWKARHIDCLSAGGDFGMRRVRLIPFVCVCCF